MSKMSGEGRTPRGYDQSQLTPDGSQSNQATHRKQNLKSSERYADQIAQVQIVRSSMIRDVE